MTDDAREKLEASWAKLLQTIGINSTSWALVEALHGLYSHAFSEGRDEGYEAYEGNKDHTNYSIAVDDEQGLSHIKAYAEMEGNEVRLSFEPGHIIFDIGPKGDAR